MPDSSSALVELLTLASDKGYGSWDTTSRVGADKRNSWTFGQDSVFCLHVRFDKFWRVVNAIYVKWDGSATRPDDQYVYAREKHKRHKLYWILNCLPDSLEPWARLFQGGDA